MHPNRQMAEMIEFLKRFMRRLRALAHALFPLSSRGEGIVLMYQSTYKRIGQPSALPQEFEQQIRLIRQKKYQVIPLSEMCARLGEGASVGGCVAIAFDSGHGDFFKRAFPILKRLNLPATVFINKSKLERVSSLPPKKNAAEMMSVGDVKRAAIANDLVEFMPYVEFSKAVSLQEAVKEVNASRKFVEDLTVKPADICTCSKGCDATQIAEYLKKTNAWIGAVTAHVGVVKKGDDPFLLKHIPIDSKVSLQVFKQKLSGVLTE